VGHSVQGFRAGSHVIALCLFACVRGVLARQQQVKPYAVAAVTTLMCCICCTQTNLVSCLGEHVRVCYNCSAAAALCCCCCCCCCFRSKTVQLVDVFYSLVTDIYEYGWGQSFHFSPKLPGDTHSSSRSKSSSSSIIAHSPAATATAAPALHAAAASLCASLHIRTPTKLAAPKQLLYGRDCTANLAAGHVAAWRQASNWQQ
jgi:hypothetical protein